MSSFPSSNASNPRTCAELAGRLSGCGWSVLATSNKAGRAPRLFDMVRSAWRWRDNYAVAQVDVYSGLAFVWAELVGAALRRAGKPYVLTLHGGSLPDFARRSRGRVRRLLAAATAVTTPSGYLREQMRPYRDRLHLLPNALDLGAYPFALRRSPQPRLVWLRAFHDIYNPSMAPRVVKLLAGFFPEVRLVMVGPDKGDGSLQLTQRVAAELGVSDRIEFVGAVRKAEVPAWMSAGDIFLNTTDVDNTPVSVLEAMACGLCVVSTDVGGVPYLLDNEETGLLVPPNDPRAMTAAVRRVLAQPGLAERLSRNARRTAEQMDWSVILPQWDSLLRDVAKGGQ